MIVTVLFLLALAAFVCIILAAMGRCPLWIGTLIVSIIELLRHIPLGR